MGQSQAESGNTLNNNTYNDPQPNTYHDPQPNTCNDLQINTCNDPQPNTYNDPQPTTDNDAQPTTFCSVHGIVNKTAGEKENKKLVLGKIKNESFPSTHLEETVHGCHDRKKMVHPPAPAPEMFSSSVSIKLERCDHLLHLQDSKLKLKNKVNVKQHCSVHGPLSDNLTMTGVETDYSNYVMDVADSESKDQMCDVKNGK